MGPVPFNIRKISDLENNPSILILNSIETDDPPTGSLDLPIEDEVLLALTRYRNSVLDHNYATLYAHINDLIDNWHIPRSWDAPRIRTALTKHLERLLGLKEKSTADLGIVEPADIIDFWPFLVERCGLDGTYPRKPHHELAVPLPLRLRCSKGKPNKPSPSPPKAPRRRQSSARTRTRSSPPVPPIALPTSAHAAYTALIEAAIRQQHRDFFSASSSPPPPPAPLLPPDFLALHAATFALLPAGLPS